MQEVKNARVSLTGEKSKPTKLKEVSSINYARIKTDMDEFNRVLGGGVVPGSLVLIGGDPGIGKSTLLLQVSTQLANKAYFPLEKSLSSDKDFILFISLSSFFF